MTRCSSSQLSTNIRARLFSCRTRCTIRNEPNPLFECRTPVETWPKTHRRETRARAIRPSITTRHPAERLRRPRTISWETPLYRDATLDTVTRTRADMQLTYLVLHRVRSVSCLLVRTLPVAKVVSAASKCDKCQVVSASLRQ